MSFNYGFLSLAVSLLALATAAGLWMYLRRQSRGTQKMTDISDAVRAGAGAFLSREYKVIAPIAVVVALLIFGLID